ncbi:MAG: deoxyribodipyrimidine photo-lyase [Rhodothermales bacterium]|nr:deoxyribodipyrimidine photo-lyase [Rhodothermales bacterium]
MPRTIVWLHNDFRVLDNPALYHASADGSVVPCVVWAPDEEGEWPPGGAHRWWLHHSLTSLREALEAAGSGLVVRAGDSLNVLQELAQETNATRVFWNQRYEPALRKRDLRIEAALRDSELEVKTFQAALLHDPDEIRTNAGDPYRVFTPFWKKFKSLKTVPEPLKRPTFRYDVEWPDSMSINELELLPTINWADGIEKQWNPGEKGAMQRLEWFIDEAASSYDSDRNRPDLDGTSMMSPYLRYGEISPRQIWNAISGKLPNDDGATSFLREVGWREFSYHLLYHYPHTTTKPLNERFSDFPWSDNEEHLRRWQQGKTGYPIVDAGMRQLWHIGWMHNRVRMIVASFLTKDLLIPWQEGAKWFWDTLVDGDLANNTQGWQWTAGSGADAQPFFRVFNPMSQSKKFDPEGAYLRQWIPELGDLPNKYIHSPWDAPDEVLSDAGVQLGRDYPRPVVDHADARKAALAAYESLS